MVLSESLSSVIIRKVDGMEEVQNKKTFFQNIKANFVSSFRIPILIRLTLLITLLLGAVSYVIANKNSEFFRKFSTTREESAELLEVKTHSAQINILLEIFVEKVKMFGTDLLAEKGRDSFTPIFKQKFNQDLDLLALNIFEKKTDRFKNILDIKKDDLLKDNSYPLELTKEDLAFAAKGELTVDKHIEKTVTDSKNKNMLRIVLPFIKDSQGDYTHIVVGYLRLEKLTRTFAQIVSRDVFLVDQKSNLIAHSKGDLLNKFDNVKDWQLVQKSFDSEFQIRQITTELLDHSQKSIQGAFSKTPYGLTVFSQTNKDFILAPSRIAKSESLYWLGLILSSSFFLVFVFSTTITNPIEKLKMFTEMVAAGDFEVKASSHIKSHDEVGELALAFDEMTSGLAERDKIRNVMNKFHGSQVADELINSELEKQGGRKDCVVYFSDIRGFTDFSERHEAEEVVEMLNDYFEIMVGIIIQNGGVVDKFIGDAIMAVWGAPKSTESDTHSAIKACLEMRRGLVVFNDKRMSEGKEPIKVGMGLHMGSVISGTIGSSERMEYTVIGDNVNMAARIEASTKAFGADVLLSHDVATAVENEFVVKVAGEVTVKGKSEKLKLYTVHGYKHADGTIELVETPYSSYKAEKADKVKVG